MLSSILLSLLGPRLQNIYYPDILRYKFISDLLKVLYIKNLSKETTSEDLARLFSRYHVKDQSEVEYKLLQHGRMRGQAFVTFSGKFFFFLQNWCQELPF